MSKTFSVVIIGSGNVAEALAQACSEAWGVEIVAVVARNEERGRHIAQLADTEYVKEMGDAPEADFHIISVSDRAVAEVAEALPMYEDTIVLHTAGSVDIAALGRERCGVLYPFQTFTSSRKVDFSQVPLFVEGSSEAVAEQIDQLAANLSRNCYRADQQRRREIHLTGVLACNFVNALYTMAAKRLEHEEGLSFEVLKPLIVETAMKAAQVDDPFSVQTGPAVRGDRATAKRHVAMLEGCQTEQTLYRLLNDYIYDSKHKSQQ